ncbi:MAG TPA: hypothetical protein VMT56_00230 [Candidatus Bathyarchaeia archaeon]|nr:hypothetical protein [Candidatus Bathyarchaeia archaeon]
MSDLIMVPVVMSAPKPKLCPHCGKEIPDEPMPAAAGVPLVILVLGMVLAITVMLTLIGLDTAGLVSVLHPPEWLTRWGGHALVAWVPLMIIGAILGHVADRAAARHKR